MCSTTQLSCGPQLWRSTTQSSVHIHTPIHDGEYAHCITHSRNQSTTQRSRFDPKKIRQVDGTPGLRSRTFIFARQSSVIRMRTMSSSVSVTALELLRGFPFGQCVAHGNAEFLQTSLGLVLRLVGLILISVTLCFLHHPINFGLRQLLFCTTIL